MPLPIVAASAIGGIVAGLAQFFASKAGNILVGLGLTMLVAKGLDQLISYAVGQMNELLAGVGSGGSSGLPQKAIQLAAYAGLFEAVNVVLAGYMTYVGLQSLKVFFARLK